MHCLCQVGHKGSANASLLNICVCCFHNTASAPMHAFACFDIEAVEFAVSIVQRHRQPASSHSCSRCRGRSVPEPGHRLGLAAQDWGVVHRRPAAPAPAPWLRATWQQGERTSADCSHPQKLACSIVAAFRGESHCWSAACAMCSCPVHRRRCWRRRLTCGRRSWTRRAPPPRCPASCWLCTASGRSWRAPTWRRWVKPAAGHDAQPTNQQFTRCMPQVSDGSGIGHADTYNCNGTVACHGTGSCNYGFVEPPVADLCCLAAPAQDASSFRSVLRQVAQDQSQQGLLDEQAAAGGRHLCWIFICRVVLFCIFCIPIRNMHRVAVPSRRPRSTADSLVATSHAIAIACHPMQAAPRCCRCSGASTWSWRQTTSAASSCRRASPPCARWAAENKVGGRSSSAHG